MSANSGNGINPKRSTAEWISLVISLLILSAIVGTVIALWLSPSGEPARFHIEQGEVRYEEGYYYVDFTVYNYGDETAAQVRVEGDLETGGKAERPSTTFDFIPGSSRENGALIFSRAPAGVVIRVVSYQKPS